MRYLKYFALLAFLALPAAYSHAQVSIGVQIGPTYGIYNAPPVCEYGFYPTYPFGCAPYGYYGPEWFADGIFIGAGPWYNFYFTHAVYYRPYYVNRGFGFHHFERFHDGDRFRNAGFRSFRDDRGFRDRDFRGRDFRDRDDFRGRSFRDNDHGHFRGNEGFRGHEGGNGYRSFNNGGDRAFRNDGGRSYNGGGEYRGGNRFYGGGESHGNGRSYGGGDSHGGGRSYGNGGSHNSGGHSYGGGSHGGGESHGGGKSYGHR